ncbi:hypothetical protein OSTOST_08829 [Ostertagia ostertagi]
MIAIGEMIRRHLVKMMISVTREEVTVRKQKVGTTASALLSTILNHIVARLPRRIGHVLKACHLAKKNDTDKGGAESDASVHGDVNRHPIGPMNAEDGRGSRSDFHSTIASRPGMVTNGDVFHKSRRNTSGSTCI